MRVLDIPRSGKRGNRVWQCNRYCQYSYPAFVPFNPRSPAQIAVRANFAAVSARWRTLTEAQRIIWCRAARTKCSKPRLFQKGRLTGILLFMKVNVALANRGLAQVDLPPGYLDVAQPTAPTLLQSGKFDQPPVGPVLFLKANQLIEGWRTKQQECPTSQPPRPSPATYSEHLRSREGRLTSALFPRISAFCPPPSAVSLARSSESPQSPL